MTVWVSAVYHLSTGAVGTAFQRVVTVWVSAVYHLSTGAVGIAFQRVVTVWGTRKHEIVWVIHAACLVFLLH